ncbi:glycine reductase [Clostridia bacterium]|nr:glycine reductase [Clostridia bacterium]
MENMVKQTLKETFEEIAVALETGSFGKKTRVGLTILGSEHGPEELVRGAELAQSQNADLEVVVIGNGVTTDLELVEAADDEDAHKKMDEMLLDGRLDSAVTMHYSFPIGVSTVGRVITPAKGKEMLMGTTTGTSDTNRVVAMIKNAIFSNAVAKACGKMEPTVGILNIEGARQVEKALTKLKEAGYPITFTESARADGGVVMRGNDLLQGVPDIMVMDSLTGNVMMKMFSAYTTGGSYEASGFGYGPGVGEGYDRIIGIISRASGAPVIAGAIRYMGSCAQGQLLKKVDAEFASARKAGLDKLLADLTASKKTEKATEEIVCPPEKTCTADIPGIEILDLEDAVHELWKAGIYASSGMGCTGPIVMMAEEDLEKAKVILKEKDYI